MTGASGRASVTLSRPHVLAGVLCLVLSVRTIGVAVVDSTLDRFPIRSDGLHLDRATHAGAFFDVVGRRSALFGYENRTFEAWVYPLKIIDDFALSFRLEGYPLDIEGRDIMASIQVRPASTTLVYAHAAFTVRQIMFAPLDSPGLVVMLDVDSVLPLAITASFRPRLRLMWPAPLTSAGLSWDANAHLYTISDETGRYAGVVGSPAARDLSVMPYQEEPRDIPNRFVIDAAVDRGRQHRIPIVIAGSVDGGAPARAAYDQILGSVRELYEGTAAHYERLDRETAGVATPDDRLNAAFRWAKAGIDKGLAANPLVGTGLVAGFRTSGDSERPGFAWFFGRDALWTTLATNAAGDFATTQTALEFLRRYQRPDGKIPHEISQSATIVPWFDQFPYAWASADATPLYVIAHADYWRAHGNRAFLDRAWPSIVSAYRFSAATDTDGNGLIENTNVGHGWVEGGALYPPHEEIYLQGLWVAASQGVAELAGVVGDGALASAARAGADRTRAAIESTYWLADTSRYAFATARPRTAPPVAEPGPERERRQQRLNALANARLVDEETVLPAVPMWWRTLDPARADAALDSLGSGAMATDWGHRILSDKSALYDPLSYHYGSVWPLFTGWASMAAYRYGRPHIGYQALMANALLTVSETGALGYVTELLSGDLNTAFGRSSHHQVWSEAMVVTPLVRGLLGVEPSDGGTRLRIAPQLPADWDRVSVQRIGVKDGRLDLEITRGAGVLTIAIVGQAEAAGPALVVSPALPLDAEIDRVTVDGRATKPTVTRTGDVQFAAVTIDDRGARHVVEFRYRGGSDVYAPARLPNAGARSEGVRVLRSRADARALRLLVEGRGGRSYDLRLRTPRQPGAVEGATLVREGDRDPILRVRFDGPDDAYSRREVVVSLR
jgi:glycogen debranching enzyme